MADVTTKVGKEDIIDAEQAVFDRLPQGIKDRLDALYKELHTSSPGVAGSIGKKINDLIRENKIPVNKAKEIGASIFKEINPNVPVDKIPRIMDDLITYDPPPTTREGPRETNPIPYVEPKKEWEGPSDDGGDGPTDGGPDGDGGPRDRGGPDDEGPDDEGPDGPDDKKEPHTRGGPDDNDDEIDFWGDRPQYEIPDEVQQMLDEYNKGAGKIEGLYETSRKEILSEARRARKESIGALQESQDEALDIFRGRAYGNMPGYQQSLEQYGAQMAGAVRDVRDRAGGGGAGLGAIADVYSSQQQGINQLGIANAQYMGARQGELGEMVRQTGLDMSGAYRTLAQDYINANLDSTGQLGGAYQAATGMRTAGMANMANYKDIAFGTNEMQPYQQELQFNIDEMRRTDPFEAEMAMNMAKYGVQYQGWQQATQGVTNATQSMWNAPAQGAGQWAQAYQVDQWLGGPQRK